MSVTEFVYLKLKLDVKPEDPSNAGGAAFLDAVNGVSKMSGYQRSFWGRAQEDQDLVIWIIEWADAHTSAPLSSFEPLLAESAQPIAFVTTTTPPVADNLAANPVTEVVVMPFDASLSPGEKAALDTAIAHFRSVLLNDLPTPHAHSYTAGWVERPGPVTHSSAPSGKALLNVMVVGWGSKDEHIQSKATKEFGEGIKPIRQKLLPMIQGLEMKHVGFKQL